MDNDASLVYLRSLAAELDAKGLTARLVTTVAGPAFIRVSNPVARTLSESVTCAPAPEQGQAPERAPEQAPGQAPEQTGAPRPWYFWWSWGERLHRVEEPAAAASKVARVLAAHA